jgi:F0F1-type ATP synthase membrane subunit b/b'
MEKLIWPAINLFGLVGFILYKTRTPFLEFVSGRRAEIFDGLNRSRAQAQETARRRKEVEAKLAGLDAEKAAIFAEWKEKELLQTQAIRESSVRVVAQMKREAEQSKMALEGQTRIAIERGFRKAVLAQAEQKIIQQLNPEVHSRIARGLSAVFERGAV